MNIIVTVKQVPDTHEVKIDPKTGTLIREGVPSIINPEDKNAIEEALRIKDNNDNVEVTALSMGPLQAETALREALCMGVDRSNGSELSVAIAFNNAASAISNFGSFSGVDAEASSRFPQ